MYLIISSEMFLIYQHNTITATQNLLYITFRGTTRGQQTFKYCGPHILNFIIKHINQTVQLAHLKNILVNYFLPLEMISCKLIIINYKCGPASLWCGLI